MIKQALIDTFAVAVAYIVIGIAFGILAYSNSFSFFEVFVAAVFVFSASLQFLLLSLLSSGASLIEILIASSLLNLRHFFYVLGALKYFRDLGFIKYYAIFTLTDESFALLSAKDYDKKTAVLILTFNHFYWIFGCIVGYFIASFAKADYSALGFSLNALFIVLAYELYIKHKENKVFFIALTLGLIGLFFIDKQYMMLSCIFSGIFILILGKKLCLIR